MENSLKTKVEEIEATEGVTGFILADQQGLCLMASPHLKQELGGVITALAKQAAKIESGSQPVILLENDTKQCFIHNTEGVTAAIFKKIVTT